MVVAALPALLLIPALLMLHEPERGASEQVRHVVAERASMWSVLRIPTLWWIIASGAFLNFNMYAIGSSLPAFLSRIHGVSWQSSGSTAGTVYLMAGWPVARLRGIWGDRISQRKRMAG